MPSPRKKLVLLASIICLVGVAALLLWPSPEPTAAGRTVTQWLIFIGPGAVSEYELAIKHFGTNAIPYMLEGIRYETPPFWYSTNALAGRICALKFIREHITRRQRHYYGALRAFQILGPQAESALPKLNRMLYTYKPVTVPGQTPFPEFVFAFPAIGPKSLPFLMSALTNEHCKCRAAVAIAFSMLRTNAQPAVPLLFDCLQDKNEMVRLCALSTLVNLKSASDKERRSRNPYLFAMDPEPFPPIEPPVRVYIALGRPIRCRIGGWDASALRHFLNTLTNAEPKIWRLATNALRQIDTNAWHKMTP